MKVPRLDLSKVKLNSEEGVDSIEDFDDQNDNNQNVDDMTYQ